MDLIRAPSRIIPNDGWKRAVLNSSDVLLKALNRPFAANAELDTDIVAPIPTLRVADGTRQLSIYVIEENVRVQRQRSISRGASSGM